VAAVVVAKSGKEIILSKLREWSKECMAPYAILTVLNVVEKLKEMYIKYCTILYFLEIKDSRNILKLPCVSNMQQL